MKAATLILAILAGAPPGDQDTMAAVGGTITLKGPDVPKRKRILISCPKCAPLYPGGMPSEDLVVDLEKHIQGAFVYVKAGLEGKRFDPPKAAVVLDQKGCRYEPHVLGIMAGQKLFIRNSDPHDHCTHAYPFSNKEFNFGQPKNTQDVETAFEHPEVMVKAKDDVYAWMTAWIGVLDHPFFAVTGPDGKYEIKGLSPGKYMLAVWQETCAPTTQEIEVKAKETALANFTLELKKE